MCNRFDTAATSALQFFQLTQQKWSRIYQIKNLPLVTHLLLKQFPLYYNFYERKSKNKYMRLARYSYWHTCYQQSCAHVTIYISKRAKTGTWYIYCSRVAIFINTKSKAGIYNQPDIAVSTSISALQRLQVEKQVYGTAAIFVLRFL